MAIVWSHTVGPGLVAVQGGDPGPECSIGRWMFHDGLPGWQQPCSDPGTECDWPPYVTCARHGEELRTLVTVPG